MDTTVETKILMQESTRKHLRIMSAENGGSMSGIVESLIEEEWKNSGHTAEYSARYAGKHTYTTHAEERRALIIEMHHGGMSVDEIVEALPRHLKATHEVVEHIISDDDADLVEQMRKGA